MITREYPIDNNFLELTNITKTFPGVKALNSVNFSARKGEIHALIGENGAGKSTLIKIISGIYNKDSGDIRINGEKIEISSPKEARLKGISTIHQELNLVPFLSAVENFWVGREEDIVRLFLNKQKMRSETEKIFKRLQINIPVDTPVKKLSVANQQMVSIARAISENAKILIMDEPTARLTADEIKILFTIIKRLAEQDVTIIYISHRLEEIFQLAHRITVLKDGEVQGTISIKDATISSIVNMMVGQTLENRFHKAQIEPGEIILECIDLCDRTKLKNVSFFVRSGEIVGIVGPVGSGRTELVKAIFGDNPILSGKILVEGKSVHPKSPANAIKNGIALIPEDRRGEGLIMHMDIAENITLPTFAQWSPLGFLRRRKDRKIAYEIAQKVDIRMSSITQRVRYLSGGNQQKVVVAKWLVKKSKLFLMDEPTAGIDVGAKAEIYKLVSNLVSEGAAVIFISSEILEVINISDRILVMRSGTVIKQFDRSEASEEKILGVILGGEIS